MTQTAAKVVRILSIEDTREYEEQGDRFVPIPGSGDLRSCDRCGREHEVHATVQLEDGSTAVVGTGCAAADDMEMAKRFSRADRAAKKLAALRAEIATLQTKVDQYTVAKAEVDALPLPAVEEAWIELRSGLVPALQMGDAHIWLTAYSDHEAWRRTAWKPDHDIAGLASAWRHARLKERGHGRSDMDASRLLIAKQDAAKVERRLMEIQ